MKSVELFQMIAVLNGRAYGPVPAEIKTPYDVVKWLVNVGQLTDNVLTQFSPELTASELLKILVEYPILQPEELPGRAPTHTAAPRRWRMGYGATRAPFANLARTDRMLAALSDLAALSPIHVRFNNLTGLVRTLRGDLLPGESAQNADEMIQAGERFLEKHGTTLFGQDQADNDQLRWTLDPHPVIGTVARFQQLGLPELPLYGAKTNFGFDDTGHLTMISSSWFPYPPAKGAKLAFKLSWEEAKAIAYDYLAQRYRIDKPTFHVSVNSIAGRTLYPYLALRGRALADLTPAHGVYRPAWAVWVVDEGQILSWEVLVDAEWKIVLNPEQTRHSVNAPLALCVLADNAAALDYLAKVAGAVSSQSVEIGGATELNNVVDFPMTGAAPPAAITCGDPAFPLARLRTGNVYYHLRKAEELFTEIVKAAWPGVNPVPIQVPGTQRPVDVQLLASNGLVGEYNPATPTTLRTLKFDNGLSTTGPTPVQIIGDPMLDCEVIYHEYAHAAFDAVQPDLFTVASPEMFRRAINEGLAFYFGVSLSRHLSGELADVPSAPPVGWGKVAYGTPEWVLPGWRDLQRGLGLPPLQRPDHDFLQVYHLFPRYATTDCDPAGAINNQVSAEYHCGMAWARILWDIRRVLGSQVADAVILRALSITGGMQTELETPAEAIVHYDGEHTAGGAAHENALRLIFSQRGIMADTPINALHTIVWAGQTYLLAASERNNQPGCAGCMFSSDNGLTWQALGLGGPDDVVALASVQDAAQLLIFAAGERWLAGSGTPLREIYQYTVAAGNGLPANGTWQALANPLPSDLDINSLQAASLTGAANQFWLFVGAEKGLHFYNSCTNKWTIELPDNRIMATSYQASPTPRLFASVKDQVGSIRLFTPVQPPAAAPSPVITWQSESFSTGSEIFLTLQADPNPSSFVWVGTLSGAVYRLSPTAATPWTPVGNVGHPVFSLWIEYSPNLPRVIYAGTTNGVISLGVPQNMNPVAPALSGETLAYTTVLAAQGIGNKLWFGTAQRGLWYLDKSAPPATQWSRQVDGFPRVGQLVDASVPPTICPWTQAFSAALQPGQVATHLLYVPATTCTHLRLTVDRDPADLQLKLFYVAPCVDLNSLQWAGLQSQELDAGLVMQAAVRPGFYLLAVTSEIPNVTYNLTLILE